MYYFGMDIRKINAKFSSDEDCLKYIQDMRWPDGVIRCPDCGCKDVKRIERTATKKGRNKRGWFFLCCEKTCHNQFSPTSGTLFHDTHLPLIVWFHAIMLVLNAKKGISAAQLQRDLGIGGYKTAWYLNHRIREAMREGSLPMLGGIVEIDETYLGGKSRGHADKFKSKDMVMGLRERKGRVRYISANDKSAETWKRIVAANLKASEVQYVMTDESSSAVSVLKNTGKHQFVRHSAGEYVRGIVHTNSVESAFSLLKRGLVGTFHQLSVKHLQKYLNEFSYRFNRRGEESSAFTETVGRMCGFPPLKFAVLTQ
jgi:transposase-like protein